MVKLGVVLGAGGTVGLAYEAGVLMALKELGGVDAAEADLLVGTSAGSIVAAHLRSGWSVEDLWRSARGEQPNLLGATAEEAARRRDELLPPVLGSPVDALLRVVGSGWILGRSLVRFPLPHLPGLDWVLPSGFLTMSSAHDVFAENLPEAWPDREIYLPSVDTVSGRRVVFGRPGSPRATLHQAVMASCAVPGVFAPVRVGKRVLVDGGIDSTTHLDLAVKAGCDLVITVAPMAFAPDDPPDVVHQLLRRVPSRWVAKEAAYAKARDVEVLVLRPGAAEVALHGVNFLRRDRWAEIADAAYQSTAAALATDRFGAVLARLPGRRRRGAAGRRP
ncbi:MAG: patatin-like phospholipase family protein [Acidimicrobiales bacterium]